MSRLLDMLAFTFMFNYFNTFILTRLRELSNNEEESEVIRVKVRKK